MVVAALVPDTVREAQPQGATADAALVTTTTSSAARKDIDRKKEPTDNRGSTDLEIVEAEAVATAPHPDKASDREQTRRTPTDTREALLQ